MKTARKVLVLALCAVLLVSATIMGTMAYLTSTDSVTNTFTVGSVNITLDEAKVTNLGVKDGNTRVKANEYHLLPGHTYAKDPTVHVAPNSEDCYLFVKVVNAISAIEDSTNNIAAQMAANNWKAVDGINGVYVYAEGSDAKTAVTNGASKTVFSSFTIAGNADVAGCATEKDNTGAVTNGKVITVTAYAVQKDGFESKTPAEIWAAANFN